MEFFHKAFHKGILKRNFSLLKPAISKLQLCVQTWSPSASLLAVWICSSCVTKDQMWISLTDINNSWFSFVRLLSALFEFGSISLCDFSLLFPFFHSPVCSSPGWFLQSSPIMICWHLQALCSYCWSEVKPVLPSLIRARPAALSQLSCQLIANFQQAWWIPDASSFIVPFCKHPLWHLWQYILILKFTYEPPQPASVMRTCESFHSRVAGGVWYVPLSAAERYDGLNFNILTSTRSLANQLEFGLGFASATC